MPAYVLTDEQLAEHAMSREDYDRFPAGHPLKWRGDHEQPISEDAREQRERTLGGRVGTVEQRLARLEDKVFADDRVARERVAEVKQREITEAKRRAGLQHGEVAFAEKQRAEDELDK